MAKDWTDEERAKVAPTRAALLRWREDRKLSRKAVGEKVGCTAGMIAWLETGEDDKLPGVALALAIESLTGGDVPAEGWLIRDLPEAIPAPSPEAPDAPTAEPAQ